MTSLKAYLNKGDGVAFMKSLKDNSIDMIITDPPYGIYGKIRSSFTRFNDSRTLERSKVAFYGDVDLKEFIEQSIRVLNKKHGVFMTFLSRDNIPDIYEVHDRYFKDYIIRPCIYEHNVSPVGRFKAKYDVFVIMYPKNGSISNYEELKEVTGKSYIQDIVHANPYKNIKFRGQKPVEILIPYIIYFTKKGMNILDPFMGTGSTGEAALSVGRNFYGSEIDVTVYEVAKMRIMAYNV